MRTLGQSGEEDVVERCANHPASCLEVVDLDPHVFKAPMTGAIRPQARTGFLARPRRDHLSNSGRSKRCGRLGPLDGAARIGRPHRYFPGDSASNADVASHQMTCGVSSGTDKARREIAARLLGRSTRDRGGNDAFEVDLGGRRRVSIDALVELCHAHLADAVGDHVVDEGPDRPSPAFEPADRDETPERASAIERLHVERRRQVEQGPLVARCGQFDAAHVIVEVELGVRHPCRRRQASQTGHDSLIELGHRSDGVAQVEPEALGIDGPIEDGERRTARVEPRVLFDVPHERLVLAHAL